MAGVPPPGLDPDPPRPLGVINDALNSAWARVIFVVFLLGIGLGTATLISNNKATPTVTPPGSSQPGPGGPSQAPGGGSGRSPGSSDVTLQVTLYAWVPSGTPGFASTRAGANGGPITIGGCPAQPFPDPCVFDVIMPKGTVLTFTGDASGGTDPWRYFDHSEGVCPRVDTNAAIAQPCTVSFDQNTTLTIFRRDQGVFNNKDWTAVYPTCPDPAYYAAVGLPPPACPPTK